jgi:alpha-glucosidase
MEYWWKLDSINAELIVIGIEHGNDERMRELTPFKKWYGGGNADAYLEFIVKTLKLTKSTELRQKEKHINYG